MQRVSAEERGFLGEEAADASDETATDKSVDVPGEAGVAGWERVTVEEAGG